MDIGLAGIKLSGSLRIYGYWKIKIIKIKIIQMNPNISFKMKYKLKEILFTFLFVPKGFEEPEMCKNSKCINTINKIINGKIKCSEKNRLRVALLIEKPPQIHKTMFVPINGMVVIRLVITVAPQKDI